jgi:hypothetical protein
MEVSNTKAYYEMAKIIVVKKFYDTGSSLFKEKPILMTINVPAY